MLILAGFIAFIPTSAALAAPMWTVVNVLYSPDQHMHFYTNFDVSSIVRNGDQVFANTKYTNELDSGEREEITIANCKGKAIVTGPGDQHEHSSDGRQSAGSRLTNGNSSGSNQAVCRSTATTRESERVGGIRTTYAMNSSLMATYEEVEWRHVCEGTIIPG